MVESSVTPVSPISAQASPRDVVEAFLRVTVDTPDLEQARLHLTKRSVELDGVEMKAMPAGATYTLGAEEADELGRRISVSVKRPAADGAAAEEMTVPMIVVEEEGQWKIDLPATMERLMGGMTEAMSKVGETLTAVSSSVGEALARGFAGVTEPAPRSAPAAAVTAGKKAAKAVQKAVEAVKKMAAKKPVKKAAAKGKKVAKKPAGKSAKKTAAQSKKVGKKAVRKAGKKAAKKKAAGKKR
jgi:hypothetical protein